MRINAKSKSNNTYDAIVVGTGISGGWSAKELTEKGLKTLVLERGRDVEHVKDYPTMHLNPWELPHDDQISLEEKQFYPKQLRTRYTVKESTKHWWVKDTEYPYTESKKFTWIRGNHVGGKSIMWGRQSYRLGELDFEANLKDGIAIDWPIRYKDLALWYDYVESYIGVSGQAEGLPHLPDGKFLPPMELNCLEQHVRKSISDKFEDRLLTIGRVANITQNHNGRTKCHNRNLCIRGCPFGAYFSSQSSTLPAAAATGNMTLRPHSIVTEVLYDSDTQKASGVRVQDGETGEVQEFYAKIIFLNASTLGSTWILMNSKSRFFPEGMGASSGELGHNLMDHHFRAGAEGEYDGFEDMYYSGRRPNGIYIPRFRNIKEKHPDFIRGYGYQGRASRGSWRDAIAELSIGKELKESISKPGKWKMGLIGFGEMLPYHENTAKLNHELLDKDGLPTLVLDCEIKENEIAMRKDMQSAGAEMLEEAGLKNVKTFDTNRGPGLAIHEMGTARMGRDPKTSVLNKWNQLHDVKNLFVTDGACMTSSACQNPSLTYMALTARAVDYAASELKKGNL
ncbi:MAG: GMC family oxidoreductase [Cyclobacteriaceae bacterium]